MAALASDYDMRWAELRIGPDRVKGAYAWATLEKSGARLAFGTDYPVEVVSPFATLPPASRASFPDGTPRRLAAARKNLAPGLHSCLHQWFGLRRFEEGKKGEIKAGEYADFIVFPTPDQSPAIRLRQHRSPPHRSQAAALYEKP